MTEMRHTINIWLFNHRKGVAGTLIFHLLLAVLFLSMRISQIAVHTEMEIVMESADPEDIREKEQEEVRREEIRQKTSEEEVERMLRSIAVNENVKPTDNVSENIEDYVNEVLEELRSKGNGGRYEAERDRHYRQDSLQNMRDRAEQTLDSMRSTFYSGKSSVSYNLSDRYARFLPIPVFKCESGGRVIVEIIVNPKGNVVRAEVLKNESAQDEILWRVAVDAAERSRFNEKPDAPSQQKGTVTYHFVKQ